MLKKASEMTEDELRAEFARIEARREQRRLRNRERQKAMTAEQKAKRLAYAKTYRERQREVQDRVRQLGAATTKQEQAAVLQSDESSARTEARKNRKA